MVSPLKLPVKITGDASGFKKAAQSAKGAAGGIGKALGPLKGAIAGAFAVGAVANFAKSIINLGSKLSDLAFGVGVNVEKFQALEAVAREVGASGDQMAAALGRIKDAQGEVASGDKLITEAFERLGVSMQDVQNLAPDQLFESLGVAIRDSGNSADAFSAAADILGQKNLPRLREALIKVADEGLGALTERMKEAGQVMDAETVATLDMMADKMDALKRKSLVAGAGLLKFTGIVSEFAAEQKAFEEEAKALSEERAAAEEARVNKLNAAATDFADRERAALEAIEARKEQDHKNHLAQIRKESDAIRKAKETEKKEAEQAEKEKQTKIQSIRDSAREKFGAVRESIMGAQASFSSLRSMGANIQGAGRMVSKEDKMAALAEAQKKIQMEMLEQLKEANQKESGTF